MKIRFYGQIFLLVFGLIIGATKLCWGQDATGKIFGTITDQQGASIAGATVVVTNINTQIHRETVTDKDGNYQVILLPLGNYQVSTQIEGFKKAESSQEALRINQSLHIDLKLEIGNNSELVEVTAQATLIETVNPTLGQSVTSRPLLNMPLNGRDVLDLALLQPGVTESNDDNGGVGNFSIAGGRTDSVTYLLDGGLNNDLLDNGAVLDPNPDTIAEFRILTSNYTAEFGRNGGGIVSVVIKSGTNQLHGSTFEFLRNDALNANSFFNKRDGLPKDVLKRNQFGFTLGGPITIPGVIKGKDRFFFFFGYQGQRQVQTQTTGNISIYTNNELRGDFSHSNGGRPDPGVVAFLQSYPFFQPDLSLAAKGIINPSRINSIAQKYIGFGLIPSSASGLLNSQAGAKNNGDELTLKLDFLLNPKDKITSTLGLSRNPTIDPFANANVAGFSAQSKDNRYFANISYIRTLSPAALNELRFIAQRTKVVQDVPTIKQPLPKDLGIDIISDNPSGPPLLSFASGLQTGFSALGPTTIVNNTFALSDTLSLVKQRHTFKFGGGYTGFQNNTLYDYFTNGQFQFSGSLDAGGIGTGNDRADFLLGLPDFYFQFSEASSNIRSKATYFFAQDEWRITNNFSLTYGLRYEYSQPKFDTGKRSFSLNLNHQSTVFPHAPQGLLFPGDPNAPRGSNFSDKNDFAPRIGFAWDPFKKGKTSIRGGFGVFYDVLKGEDNLQFNGQIPFYSSASLGFSPLTANPTQEVNYLSQPFVAAGTPNPFPSQPPSQNLNFADAGFLPFGGNSVYFVDPHLRTPYIYQFNLGIQQQLLKNLVLEVNYVGSSAHKLTSLVDANPFILGTQTRLFDAQPGVAQGTFSYLDEFRNVSSSNYHSLEVSVQKQLSESKYIGSTYFTFAYTLAHSIDNASGFRQRNSIVPAYETGLFRSSADSDVRQRISFSGGWDLPLEHLWMKGPKRLLQGWSIYPIITFRTGFPLDILAGLSQGDGSSPGPSGAGDASIVHANLVGNSITTVDPHGSTTFNGTPGNYYFNPGLFSNAGLSATDFNPNFRTYGTLPRNAFRGPSRTNVDLAIAKTLPIVREKLKAEFRAEFFNLFNHAEFKNPDTSITSGTFGQVLGTADPRIIQLAVRLSF